MSPKRRCCPDFVLGTGVPAMKTSRNPDANDIAMSVRFTMNGWTVEATPADAEMPLLCLLREEPLALNGPSS